MQVSAADLNHRHSCLFFLKGNSFREEMSFGPRSETELDLKPGSLAPG